MLPLETGQAGLLLDNQPMPIKQTTLIHLLKWKTDTHQSFWGSVMKGLSSESQEQLSDP